MLKKVTSTPKLPRRRFLQVSAALTASLTWHLPAATGKRPPRILLRSSWQVVNIGDIAHTPGVLALLEKHIPETEVQLWASADLSPEVAAMLRRRFPNLRIVKGTLGKDGRASNTALGEAVEWADFLLHGSGPFLVARADVAAFVQLTRKPFGVYGITCSGVSPEERDLLNQAKFVFFRDGVSLDKARAEGVKCPIMEFGPDGAFAADVRDDPTAAAFLRATGLADKKFVCCIPRLRYTPYWKIHKNRPLDEQKQARNEAMKEHDHAPLREAIAAVTRETGCHVLICPEDMSQMEVGREMLLEKLPREVRSRVVWREKFWLTDEALSVYARSAGLFGLEMHSPILCVGHGIPALLGRFAEQTSKGFMWRDIGLGDWLFDFDQPDDLARLTPTVLKMIQDPAAARAKVEQARAFVAQRQRETMAVLRRCLAG